MPRCVLLFDVISFYVSAERVRDASLIGKPIAVTQFNQGGFVAVSPEAAACGIRKGDGIGEAGRVALNRPADSGIKDVMQKCPDIRILPMDTPWYREVSERVYTVLKDNSRGATVHKSSLDDYYMEIMDFGTLPTDLNLKGDVLVAPSTMSSVTKLAQPWDTVAAFALRLKATIETDPGLRGLTVACGFGDSKMAAKLACPLNKPGLTYMPAAEFADWIGEVDIRKVPGLKGKLGYQVVESLHIKKISDLIPFSSADLVHRFGERSGLFLHQICRGIDDTPVQERVAPKSLLCEISSNNFNTSPGTLSEAIHKVSADLVVRLEMDHAEWGDRWIRSLGIVWRIGFGNLQSAGVELPLALKEWRRRHKSNLEDQTKVIGAVEAAVAKVLKSHLTPASRVTRIALQVRSFTDISGPGLQQFGFGPGQSQTTRCPPASKSAKVEPNPSTFSRTPSPPSLPTPPSSSSKRPRADDSFICEKCGGNIALENLYEHEDLHYAQSLTRDTVKMKTPPTKTLRRSKDSPLHQWLKKAG